MSDFIEWAAHGIKRGRFESNRRTVGYVVAVVLVLTLIAAFYLMLVSRTAAQGRHIQQLQAEWFQMKRENEQLRVDLARVRSVERLRERADALGFIVPEQVEFLYPTSDP
jgi:cell division protein FtsL